MTRIYYAVLILLTTDSCRRQMRVYIEWRWQGNNDLRKLSNTGLLPTNNLLVGWCVFLCVWFFFFFFLAVYIDPYLNNVSRNRWSQMMNAESRISLTWSRKMDKMKPIPNIQRHPLRNRTEVRSFGTRLLSCIDWPLFWQSYRFASRVRVLFRCFCTRNKRLMDKCVNMPR